MKTTRQTAVLTIEDEPAVRSGIVAYLEDRGFVILEAQNGRIGLEVFRRENPDVVLADLRMPDVDGLEVLETIGRESPGTPTIAVSGTGVIADAVEALHRGAWDFVLKPMSDLAVLLHAIKKALERAQMIREQQRHQAHLEAEVTRRTRELEAANQKLTEEMATRGRADCKWHIAQMLWRSLSSLAYRGLLRRDYV